MEYIYPFVEMLNEMSPYLLLGFFIAGLLHVYVPATLYHKHLGNKGFGSVIKAAAFGIPLPLCSCGVIPTAMSLRNEGATHGATVSFLIATPQTGVDSIVATWSLLGLPMAIIRPIAALITALLGGLWADKADSKSLSEDSINGSSNACQIARKTPKNKFISALKYGFVDMLQDVGKWLLIGLFIAGAITILVPDDIFASFASNKLLNMLIILALSIPMYLCATGSIPIAAALMLKGLTPGAALVLLMAGPATNAAALMVVGKVLGRKTLLIYLFSIIVGAITFGLIIDTFLPLEWFALQTTKIHCAACHGSITSWWQWASSVILISLTVYALFKRRFEEKNEISKNNNKMTKTFKIGGMSCNHCKNSVETNLAKLEGVESVAVDLTKGVAIVNGNANEKEVKDIVERLGFTYNGVLA